MHLACISIYTLAVLDACFEFQYHQTSIRQALLALTFLSICSTLLHFAIPIPQKGAITNAAGAVAPRDDAQKKVDVFIFVIFMADE